MEREEWLDLLMDTVYNRGDTELALFLKKPHQTISSGVMKGLVETVKSDKKLSVVLENANILKRTSENMACEFVVKEREDLIPFLKKHNDCEHGYWEGKFVKSSQTGDLETFRNAAKKIGKIGGNVTVGMLFAAEQKDGAFLRVLSENKMKIPECVQDAFALRALHSRSIENERELVKLGIPGNIISSKKMLLECEAKNEDLAIFNLYLIDELDVVDWKTAFFVATKNKMWELHRLLIDDFFREKSWLMGIAPYIYLRLIGEEGRAQEFICAVGLDEEKERVGNIVFMLQESGTSKDFVGLFDNVNIFNYQENTVELLSGMLFAGEFFK